MVVLVVFDIVLVSTGRLDAEEKEALHWPFTLTVTVVVTVVMLLEVSLLPQAPAQFLVSSRESPVASRCCWPETNGPAKAKRAVASDSFILEESEQIRRNEYLGKGKV